MERRKEKERGRILADKRKQVQRQKNEGHLFRTEWKQTTIN